MRRVAVWAGVLYLAVLLASTVARWRGEEEVPPGRQLARVASVEGSGARGEPVRVGYFDWPAVEGAGTAAPIVLLHGSPGSATNFRALVQPLTQSRRAIAIDLPGFGASELDVPNYSVRAHAVYVADLLEQLGIPRYHLLGFSMGGGVALHLAEDHPDRVLSVSMVAAIGVQELELLGDYSLNHFIHGAQLLGLVLAQNLIPHFGVLDGFPLGREYARNFYDTDQRPLRGILERLEQPLLVVHGQHDPLVPAEAAVEHARLAPHSELQMLDASHFFIFRADPRLVQPLERFLQAAETGTAPRRHDALPERVRAAEAPFDPSVIPPWVGPALLVVLLVLALATFVSEDLTCIAAGLLVAQGRLAFAPAALACYVGIVAGDMLLFWAGRYLGRPALRRRPLRWWVSERALDESSRWLARRGGIVVLLSRFLPGARLPTNLAAGILRTSALRFFLYFAAAGVVWTPPFVWLSAKLGDQLLPRLGEFRNGALLAVLLLGLLMWLVRHLVLPLLSWRGRRRLAGAWGKLTRWEFWPWWAIYPPVILSILRRGLQHRSPTLFTCVNPAIPGGGIVGESKSDILEALGNTPALPRWARLPPGPIADRAIRVAHFVDEHGLDYPIVLKPDWGERGSGVAIVHEEAEIGPFLERTPQAALVQEYAPGLEFGVFYVRGPEDAKGRILSINRKEMPSVRGDGHSTLEQLILRDPRAVKIQNIYLAENPHARSYVPADGEDVPLTEVGAHSRGTLFLDGTEHITDALAKAFDEVHAGSKGIDFGRFDVRVPSVEALREGRDFKILELNGVTSEAAHMYDPKYGLRDAWRILADQWRVAFEIGAQRRRAGQRPLGLLRFLRLVARGGSS